MMSTDDVVRVHTTGYRLEEVKVILHHDIKLNIKGIEIEGKQGEILNVPRWIAEVLESEKHAKIEEADMVVELKQALVKENIQGKFDLATLDPHFYIRLKSYMKKLPTDNHDRVKSMLITLVRIRQGKIISLADSAEKLTANMSSKLTVEERLFYENIYKNSIDFKNQILGDKK